MSTDTEVDRKWDELADRGDLRAVMQRIDSCFDRIDNSSHSSAIPDPPAHRKFRGPL